MRSVVALLFVFGIAFVGFFFATYFGMDALMGEPWELPTACAVGLLGIAFIVGAEARAITVPSFAAFVFALAPFCVTVMRARHLLAKILRLSVDGTPHANQSLTTHAIGDVFRAHAIGLGCSATLLLAFTSGLVLAAASDKKRSGLERFFTAVIFLLTAVAVAISAYASYHLGHTLETASSAVQALDLQSRWAWYLSRLAEHKSAVSGEYMVLGLVLFLVVIATVMTWRKREGRASSLVLGGICVALGIGCLAADIDTRRGMFDALARHDREPDWAPADFVVAASTMVMRRSAGLRTARPCPLGTWRRLAS